MTKFGQVRLLIGGPANSGKSTLCTSLFHILRDVPDLTVGIHEIDVYSDTHGPLLGLKPWSERKKNFHAGRSEVDARMAEFLSDRADLVIGDLPGNIRNPHLPVMMAGGTHAMYVGRSFDEYEHWKEAFIRAKAHLQWTVLTAINGSPVMALPPHARLIRDLTRETCPKNTALQEFAREIADFCQVKSQPHL